MLFTIGFALVKRGNPFKYGGGDSYNRRRMFRMLGWMMWTTAAVMSTLGLVTGLSNPMSDATVAQSTGRPEIESIRTVTRTAQLIPNLLHEPALKADAATEDATNSAPTGSLTLTSILAHHEAIQPNLINPVPERVPVPVVTMDDIPPEQATASALAPAAAPAPEIAPTAPAIRAVTNPTSTTQLDAELAAANEIVKKAPSSVVGYLQRGNVYANERQWDLAQADYRHALEIDHTCGVAAFNIAEIDFLQGHYDAARPGFLSVVNSSDYGDLAKYRVFLCDLFGGHEQIAAKELAVFNQVGSEASYYFANVAWSAYHKKQDDAQSWLESAKNIFAPAKVTQYAQPLVNLGYINLTS